MKILLCTDGSKPSHDAATLILRLGDPTRHEVTVLSVLEDHLVAAPSAALYVPPASNARDAAEERGASVVDELTTGGFAATFETRVGVPAEEIGHAAQHGAFDLIALGSGTKSWLGSILLGSTSLRVLHTSPMPVLVVHEAHGDGPGRVLFAADGSVGAQHALDALVRFLDPSRVEVVALSVAPQPHATLVELPGMMPGAMRDDEVQQELIERAQAAADHARDGFVEHGFRAKSDLTVGHASTQLLKEAESGGFDLVALGSRGMSALARTALGSVSDHIARHASAAFVGKGPRI